MLLEQNVRLNVHTGERRKKKQPFICVRCTNHSGRSKPALKTSAVAPRRLRTSLVRRKAPQQRATPQVSIHQNGAFYGPSKDNAACSSRKWRQTLQTQIKQWRRRVSDKMFGVICRNQLSWFKFMNREDAQSRVLVSQFTPGVLKHSFHTAL